MSPSALYALGLGEIRLNSALNQPFDAEIELVSAAQEDLSALQASLASNDTFVRYGLDKPSYLSDFSFRVVRSNGRDVLRITSPRPVTEPFVTLLVEASWPRGRLLREYTVLLDPPVFSPAPAASEAPVAAPRATAAPAVPARPAPAAPVASAPAPSESRPSRAVAAPLALEAGSTYRVRPNDTLWKIASAANPGPRSEVNRAMVAIYQANPQAFGGNINVLRAGSELAIPTSSDVAAISASAATAEVARQYQMWRDGSAATAGPAADAGRLRLVTPEQGSATPSTATAVPATPAGDADIQARVQQLEAELAEARRLLEVRNAELATLQGGAPADAAAPGEPVVAEPAPSGEVTPETTEPVAEAPQAVAPEPAAEPEPTPAPPPAAEESPSLLERLGQYWWLLVGLLAAALGIGALLRRRRESGAAEESLEEALGRRSSDDLRARPTMTARPRESDIVVEERQAAEPTVARGAAAVAAAPRAPEPSRKPVTIDDTLSGEGPASIEASDPLAEADFHMAYGLYDQAADLVQLAAKREPQRRDLKLKLLEIFFVWGNRDRFLEVARDLGATRAQAPAGEWDKILIMGKQMAADDPLFAGSVHGSGDSLDMELQRTHASIDMDLLGGEGPGPDLDLTATAPKVASEGGLDFILDEPVRGADEDEGALAPTLETQRIKPAASDDPTAEVAIEDLGLDVGDFEGFDDLEQQVDELLTRPSAKVEDTIERPTLGRGAPEPEEDLLSSTSILRADAVELAEATREVEAGLVDLADATSELPTMTSEQPTIEAPTIEATAIDATSVLRQVDFPLDEESATMSEVGTKLDLARAYIDMGDPEGARSIL
ncbi:MAG: LysM peptidoglycan-binding domain-containing protein, partial [Gammaproteobacteria bacterium]|nr:LysM peptidoglycan-binding domain-containing protein [Gammaproteobacteria bacterium]